MSACLFCKIATHQIPAQIIYEDEDILAFNDIYPKAQVHFLIIPKLHIKSMLELEDQHQALMGKIMLNANKLAKESKLEGYKVQVNTGVTGGQEIFHLHIHVLGNR